MPSRLECSFQTKRPKLHALIQRPRGRQWGHPGEGPPPPTLVQGPVIGPPASRPPTLVRIQAASSKFSAGSRGGSGKDKRKARYGKRGRWRGPVCPALRGAAVLGVGAGREQTRVTSSVISSGPWLLWARIYPQTLPVSRDTADRTALPGRGRGRGSSEGWLPRLACGFGSAGVWLWIAMLTAQQTSPGRLSSGFLPECG